MLSVTKDVFCHLTRPRPNTNTNTSTNTNINTNTNNNDENFSRLEKMRIEINKRDPTLLL